ncbi:conjugal transfer protein TraR, partial [Aeromonas hydrophila]
MSRLDDELERLADISEQQLAARIHAARISGTG